MAGEAGTSVGVITLDLRIVSKIAEQLDAIAATANKSAQQSFGDLGKAVDKAISKPVEKAGKTMEEAITAPVENAQKVVQDTLQKTQDQTDKTMDQINAAIASHQAEAQKLLQEKVALPETAPRVPSATASEIFKKQGKDIDTSGHAANAPPDLSDTFLPAADGAELLHQKMANVQMQFDAEREKLAALNSEFAKVATGSKAWDELSAKITAAEGRLISLQSTLNATQAKIDAPAQKAAAAAEKAAAAQERAAQKAAAAQEKAQQRAAAAAEKAAVHEEAAQAKAAAVAAAATKKSGASMGTVRTQANAMLSAVTSTTQGVAKVGVLGRALSSSLTGSLAIAGPLAIAAAAFGILRKSISLATVNSDQFKSSLNQVKANLEVAFTPIYQAILPALNAMMSWLAAATKQIAAFISALFGKTYAQSVAATKQMQKNADAAKKAKSGGGKENDRTVASFDKLNIIGKKDSGSGSADDINYDALDTKGTAAATGLADKFKAAWAGIASGFQDYVVKPIQANLSVFDAPVAKFKALFADVGAQCKAWMKPLSDWLQNDFKQALSTSIKDSMIIFAGFGDSVAIVAKTVWNALKPVIDWFIKNGLPILTKIWVQLNDTAVTAFNLLKTIFDTLWNGVIDPFAQFVSKVIVDILNTFKKLWDQYGATTFENIRKTIDTVKGIFLSVWNTTLKPIFDQLFKTLNELWTNHLQPLVAQIGEFVAKLVNGAMDIFNGFVAPMIKWFVSLWGPQVAGSVNTVIKTIGTIVGIVADVAKDLFSALGGVVDFLTGVFTGNWSKAWKGVQEIFSGIFHALYDIARGPLNAVIGLVNNAISGIDSLIKNLNSIHYSGTNPLNGEKFSIGFNIPTIPSIPYLANGGILTQPTLAMMGEYSGAKSNPEIATPQSLMRDTIVSANGELVAAFAALVKQIIQAIRENGGRGDVYLNGKKISQETVDYINAVIRSTGKSPIIA